MENELYKSKSGQGVANLLWYKQTNKQRILVNFSISKNSMALGTVRFGIYCVQYGYSTVQYSSANASTTVLYSTVPGAGSLYSTLLYPAEIPARMGVSSWTRLLWRVLRKFFPKVPVEKP